MIKKVIKPKRICGMLTAPPSQSLLHRALIAAALAEGETIIHGLVPPLNLDNSVTLQALVDSGLCTFAVSSSGYRVFGGHSARPTPRINCYDSFSSLALLLPALLLKCKGADLYASERLLAGINRDYLELFASRGATYEFFDDHIEIRGRLRSGAYQVQGGWEPQYASGLLLALPLLATEASVVFEGERFCQPDIEMTMATTREFGAYYMVGKDKIEIEPISSYYPGDINIEGDYGYAANFIGAAALAGDISIAGLPKQSSQGDAYIVHLLTKMGAVINREDELLRTQHSALKAIDAELAHTPGLLPLLAVLCTQAAGTSHLQGIGKLGREDARCLKATVAGLAAMGANISQDAQQLVICGPTSLQGRELDAENASLAAMALAVAAHIAQGDSVLVGTEAVARTAPGFWADLVSLD